MLFAKERELCARLTPSAQYARAGTSSRLLPQPWSVPIVGDEVTSLSAPILPAPYAVVKVLSVCTSL